MESPETKFLCKLDVMGFTCYYGPDSYIISNIGKSILILGMARTQNRFSEQREL
jgi:hypothetical protein